MVGQSRQPRRFSMGSLPHIPELHSPIYLSITTPSPRDCSATPRACSFWQPCTPSSRGHEKNDVISETRAGEDNINSRRGKICQYVPLQILHRNSIDRTRREHASSRSKTAIIGLPVTTRYRVEPCVKPKQIHPHIPTHIVSSS
jgi:hypothetical protein